VSELRDFLAQGHVAFVWDYLAGQWKRVLRSDLAPGYMYLVAASEGGYLATRGWSPKSRVSVTTLSDVEPTKSVLPEANDSELAASRQQTLKEHTEEVVAELDELLHQLGWPGDSGFASAVHLAARWHDRGKAHPVFQMALNGHQAVDGDGAGVDLPPAATEILAKSGHRTQLAYRRRGFRHELAGALAALQASLPDLVCYLVAAHHGKVRLSIRSLPFETKPGDASKRFARGVWDGDTLPEVDLGAGCVAPLVTLSLQPAELGLSAQEEPSWAERMLRLRDGASVGPYRLAFLESLVRVADMRASARAANDDAHTAFECRHVSALATQQEGNEYA
jgi:CRISPR-associated endonuclease/helicase Cas3